VGREDEKETLPDNVSHVENVYQYYQIKIENHSKNTSIKGEISLIYFDVTLIGKSPYFFDSNLDIQYI